MSDTPENSVPSTPETSPAGLRPPAAPSVGLRPPTSPAPAATPPVLRPAAAAAAKLPERRAFVSPMPTIESSDDSIPAFLPIIAGFAAAVSIAFAVLLYLKQ